jgi:hypothetical protein
MVEAMATQVSVNPGVITINDGASFLLTASNAFIEDNQIARLFCA